MTFSPDTAAVNAAAILIESDDPTRPIVEVPLTGTGIAPIIEVTPNAYDFGTLCRLRRRTATHNQKCGNCRVDRFYLQLLDRILDITFDAQESVNGALPWSIQPNQEIDVIVEYNPYDEVLDQAFLTITSNDPYTPDVLVTQEGNGDIFGVSSDEFEQPIKGSTDIIFGVDISCSMDEDEIVQANFGTFVNTLSAMDADYQVTAVSGTSATGPHQRLVV